MRVAGIRRLGAPVEVIEVTEPWTLAGDEVLVSNTITQTLDGLIGAGPDPRPRRL